MQTLNWIPFLWLAFATILEIVANIFLKYSDGFNKPVFGILSLAAVLTAFGALSQAVKVINLSVAYALWGGFGIIATAVADFFLFGRKLSRKGWIGILLLLIGMTLIKFA